MSDEMTPDLIAAAVVGYQHGSGVATFLRRPHLRRKTIEQERSLLRERSAPVNIGAPLRRRRGSHIHTGLFRQPRPLRSLSDRTPLHRLCNKPRYDRRRRR